MSDGLLNPLIELERENASLRALCRELQEALAGVEHVERVEMVYPARKRCPACRCSPVADGGDGHDAECPVAAALARATQLLGTEGEK